MCNEYEGFEMVELNKKNNIIKTDNKKEIINAYYRIMTNFIDH